MTTDPLGTDWETTISPAGQVGLEPSGKLVSGRRCYVLAIVRRLSTAPGTLPRHPRYGYDVASLRGKRMTPAEVAEAEGAVVAQCLMDERTLEARAEVVLTGLRALSVRVELEDAEGPFALVFALSAAGAIATILEAPTP